MLFRWIKWVAVGLVVLAVGVGSVFYGKAIASCQDPTKDYEAILEEFQEKNPQAKVHERFKGDAVKKFLNDLGAGLDGNRVVTFDHPQADAYYVLLFEGQCLVGGSPIPKFVYDKVRGARGA